VLLTDGGLASLDLLLARASCVPLGTGPA
jgi:hypothetical protein